MAQFCRNRESRQYDFIMIQTAKHFYRNSLVVEHWINPGHLNTERAAIYCVDDNVQVNRKPIYGAHTAEDNFKYIIPGTFPTGTSYPEHCSGSYIITMAAVEPLLDAVRGSHRNDLRREDVFITGIARIKANLPIYSLPSITESNFQYLLPYFWSSSTKTTNTNY